MNKLSLVLLVATTTLSAFKLSPPSTLSKEACMTIESFYKDKKVLVTGGCGFIGSHIAAKLVKLGAHVTIIDNLSTGSLDNIEPIKNKIRFIQKSITNQDACHRAVSGNDIIFHLAAYISVPGSVKDPAACHNVNVNGMFNMLEAAKQNHVDRFVFSSTSAVYGPREDVCKETDTNLNPISPYGATKLMGEIYCQQYAVLFGVPCAILRYFNVYGPRQNPHSAYAAVVAKFEYHMKRNEQITIFGDGKQTRDFVHVNDVVEANLIMGMAPESKVNRHCFNIGTGTSISVLELAQDMKKEFPEYSYAEPKFEPARDGDVKHTQMSAEKFSQLKTELF